MSLALIIAEILTLKQVSRLTDMAKSTRHMI